MTLEELKNAIEATRKGWDDIPGGAAIAFTHEQVALFHCDDLIARVEKVVEEMREREKSWIGDYYMDTAGQYAQEWADTLEGK